MPAREVVVGRTLILTFEHGDDFFGTLQAACEEHGILQGYIPMFIAGFAAVDVVGTCEALDDPRAPVWNRVQLRNVEAVGAGTVANSAETGVVVPHIHVSVGLKEHSATAHTSHLLSATTQFLVEMVMVEILAPRMERVPDHMLYGVPLLSFGTGP
jgi:predicted DNA-binding protein with PD1-like motif